MAEPIEDQPSRRRRRPTHLRNVVLLVIAVWVIAGSWDHWSVRYAIWRNDPDAYAFRFHGADGAPVTYSSCHPIEIVVNPRTMPAGAAGLLEEAAAEVAEASGLQVRVAGETATTPDAWGGAWGTVLVAWSDPAEVPALDGNAGLGGSMTGFVGVGGRVEVYTSGRVTLNGPSLSRTLGGRDGRARVRAVITHELGHVLGLDHVDDPGQLMYGEGSRVDDLRAGDRNGLARLGQGPCISPS